MTTVEERNVIELFARTQASFTDDQTWDLLGLDAAALITIHEALKLQRDLYLQNIREAHQLDGKSKKDIGDYFNRKFLSQDYIDHMSPDDRYDASEDLMFLATEVAKISEIMFRIKTEKGVF